MSFLLNSTFGLFALSGGGGGTVTGANNGASLSGANVVLGNDVGGVGAVLLSDREIPTAGFDTHFSGLGSITVGDSPLNGNITVGQFNNLPKLVLAGGKPTFDFHIEDDGFVGGMPWGSANLVWRATNANTPKLTNLGVFGDNVTGALNFHYGTVNSSTPYTSTFEWWMATVLGDVIPFSIYGKGTHFAGNYNGMATTVRIANSQLIGWNNATFDSSVYILGQPQLSLRAETGKNTQLELSNPGTSLFTLENQIFFSVDNAPIFVASSYPSNKTVFVTKSSTSVNGTIISSYLATNNVISGANLAGQEMMSFIPQPVGGYLPTVAINFKLALGNYLSNDGYLNGKVSTLIVDAFNQPFYFRKLPQINNTLNNILVIDTATQEVKMSPFAAPSFTTTQKNALSATAGMIVYDSTLAKLCIFTTAWETITSV